MYFLVIIFTCFVGIQGQDCRPWQEPGIHRHASYQDCERAVRVLAEDIKRAGPYAWGQTVPTGEYRVSVKGFCMVPVLDEVAVG